MKALLLALSLVFAGCAGRQAVIVHAAVTEACHKAEEQCFELYRDGKISGEASASCLECAHATCDLIVEQVTGGGE